MDPDLIDANLVFAKTPAGEEAMLQRTRVVQRNVRMVLILVDGNASVAELCEKTGNSPMTQNALLELERDGFIERRVDKDSVWQHAKTAPKGLIASAIQAVSEFSTFGAKGATTTPRPTSPETRERRIISFPRGREYRPTRPLVPPESQPPQPSPGAPELGTATPSHLEFAATSPPAPAADPAAGLAAAGAAISSPTSLHDHERTLAEPVAVEDGRDLKPIRRRGRRGSLTWPMRLLLGSLLLCGVIVVVARFFPYAYYLPEVEAGLAKSAGQPASLAEMRVSFYPRPGLLLGKVRLGSETEQDQIEIAEMRLQPALGTLLSPTMLFSEIELSGLSLSAAGVANLSRMLASVAREPSAGVLRIAFSKTTFAFAGLTFGEMSGGGELSADRHLESIALQSPDRSLQLTLKPTASGATVHIEGLAWRPLAGSPYVFDSVSLRGEIAGPDFSINSVDLRIFDGLVRGTAILRANQQAAMAGDIAFERINARKFTEALGLGGQLEGESKGRLKFSASAESWSSLLMTLQASGDFAVHRGRLRGIDLAEAIRRASPTPATLGGWTRFEDLSGAITLTPSMSRFSRLALNAGLMQAAGQIDVSRDLQLRGRMEVMLRGSADQTARPIVISGSLKSPLTQTGNR